MRGPALYVLAWRNLWRHRLRTALTLVAIAFGGFFAVIMTATHDRSFADFVDTAARLGSGHVAIQHPDYADRPTLAHTVRGTDEKRAVAESDPRVSTAVERTSGTTMLSTTEDSFGALFIAFDPTAETEQTMRFRDAVVAGEMFPTADAKGIVLGSTLAKNLGATLGDKIVYTLTDRHGEIVAGMERLSGILTTHTPSLDVGLALLPLGTVRQALGYGPEEATQVAVFLSDSRQTHKVAKRLVPLIPDAAVLTWDRVMPEIRSFIAMKIGGGRFMAVVVAILVCAGIFNTLFVSVLERMREFGILRALGYSSGQLFRLVMWESAWLALLGIVAGTILTVPVYLPLAKNGIDLTEVYTSGGQALEVAGVGFDMVLRIGIFPEHVLFIALCIVFATLAAGLYPAWRVGHVEPVESIKLV
ncbi:MAG: ABC transporter permease [Deltaproteobacteria bacterium]|nr:ABC transporter permease [Deltaproteobacteria bacterium]